MAKKKKTEFSPHEKLQPDGGIDDMILFHEGERRITAEQKKELTKKLKKDPDDLRSRLLLLGYLSERRRNRGGSDSFLDELAWLIENHPRSQAHPFANSGYRWLKASRFMEFKKRWLRQVRLNPNDPEVLWNAAHFLIDWENELAESDGSFPREDYKYTIRSVKESREALTKQISKLAKPQSKKQKQSSKRVDKCSQCGKDWHPRGKKN